LFFSYSFYQKYHEYLDKEFLKQNSKALWKLATCVDLFHEKYPEKNIGSVSDLHLFFFENWPATSKTEQAELDPLFKRLQEANPDAEVVESYLTTHRQRTIACRLAIEALEVSDGKRDWEQLLQTIAEMDKVQTTVIEDEFVGDDLEVLYEKVTGGGLRWRLSSLGKSLGPLRVGDFGFIFARPESGKTTFLADQVSFMAEQCDRPVIWFNNEEQGEKVVSRLYQASLGITTQALFSNLTKWKELYKQKTDGRIKVYDSAVLRRRDVDRICAKYNPGLIIIDQIDKVKGFEADRKDLEFKEIYQWARELAKKYGPVIAVCQAGGTGEGKKWLTMDDVDSSKTSKQGEADWILGIGKSNNEGMESVRHFCISKNKLLGDSDTIPELRHGKFEVIIKPEIARYQDIGK
jgi:hypothetical protein